MVNLVNLCISILLVVSLTTSSQPAHALHTQYKLHGVEISMKPTLYPHFCLHLYPQLTQE